MTAQPGPSRRHGRSRRTRFLIARSRRVLAAVLLAVAGWVGVAATRPVTGETGIPVLVAARDLPAGARLEAADVREARLPAAAIPERALVDPRAVDGHVLAGPVGAGEVLTTTRLQGPGMLVGAPAGTVAVAVPVADPTILTALRAGDRVRLLALGTGAVVAEATVLVAEAPGGQAGVFAGAVTGVGSGPGDGGGGRLLAALTPADAVALAAAGGPAGVSGGFVVAVLGSG